MAGLDTGPKSFLRFPCLLRVKNNVEASPKLELAIQALCLNDMLDCVDVVVHKGSELFRGFDAIAIGETMQRRGLDLRVTLCNRSSAVGSVVNELAYLLHYAPSLQSTLVALPA